MLEFNIIRTEKVGIDAAEHYIVEFNDIVYLRAINTGQNFIVMTATASEDNKVISAFKNQRRLISEAILVVKSYAECPSDYSPAFKQDCCGREYVELFSCVYLSDLYRYSDKLLRSLLESNDTTNKIEPATAA